MYTSRQRQTGYFPNARAGQRANGKARRRQSSSTTTSLKQQLLLIGGTLAGMAIWYLTPVSEFVVQLLLETVPIEADLDLGRQALQQEFAQRTYYDARWTPQLEQIGYELVQANPEAQVYPWDFGVIRERKLVNAFALPGGIVRVTQGLLDQLALTKGEIAALLGHEMGHVIHRHSQARILERELLTTVLQALVYKDNDAHQESFGEAVGELLLKSADWLGQQSFSRSNEYQADATSWDLLSATRKYNPQALQSLLSKLWDYHGRQGGETSWDSTHPGTFDRIQALDDKYKALTYSEKAKLNRNTVM